MMRLSTNVRNAVGMSMSKSHHGSWKSSSQANKTNAHASSVNSEARSAKYVWMRFIA